MKIRERIEEIRGYINRYDLSRAMGEIRELGEEYGHYELLDDVIDTDYLDEMVRMRLESGGWQGVACMLSDISSLNDEYYRIDGYGNIEDFDRNDCEMIIDELEILLENDIEEEDDDDDDEEEVI